jgi:hypothetical protein
MYLASRTLDARTMETFDKPCPARPAVAWEVDTATDLRPDPSRLVADYAAPPTHTVRRVKLDVQGMEFTWTSECTHCDPHTLHIRNRGVGYDIDIARAERIRLGFRITSYADGYRLVPRGKDPETHIMFLWDGRIEIVLPGLTQMLPEPPGRGSPLLSLISDFAKATGDATAS